MGCSMGATARALVRASVLAQDPHASPAALRRALFLRFYGHEFDAAEQERIMEWLDRADTKPEESPRRVPVNWDDLEMALTSSPGEWSCYLDVRSGEVQMVPVDRFGDDGDWPSEEGRFASDFGDASRIATPWLRELTEAAADASVPFLFGGHALVSDGLRLIVAAAWQGR